MNARIAVLGSKGFLGSRLVEELSAVPIVVDITDATEVYLKLKELGPFDVCINAAGKTGRPNVDWCEENRVQTMNVNAFGPLNVSEGCQELGIHLIHLASGCIYYGNPPDNEERAWTEDDFANPKSYYSKTKYAADLLLSGSPASIVRLRMPIDSIPNPRNLLTKLAGYKTICDVQNSVTVIDDLVEVVKKLCETRTAGTFHCVNPGLFEHKRFVSLYREVVDSTFSPEIVSVETLKERGLIAGERSNCRLSSYKVSKLLGRELGNVNDILPGMLYHYKRELDNPRPVKIEPAPETETETVDISEPEFEETPDGKWWQK